MGRTGRVYIYHHLGAKLLQLVRVVSRYVAVRGPGARLPFFSARKHDGMRVSLGPVRPKLTSAPTVQNRCEYTNILK